LRDSQPVYPGVGIAKLSPGKEFAFQFDLNAVARIIAETEAEARERLRAIECVDLSKVDVPALDGVLTEASIASDPNEAELFEIDGDPPCRECGEPYEEGGDGWDGLCPSCADRASMILDAEEDGWNFFETSSGWYAEREEQRTQLFSEQVEAAYFVDEARDILDLPDPGKPDIVYLSRRKAIFVHGCFWHGHDCARGARVPQENRDYWLEKIGRNRARDAKVRAALQESGWKALVVWECQLRDERATMARLERFMRAASADDPE